MVMHVASALDAGQEGMQVLDEGDMGVAIVWRLHKSMDRMKELWLEATTGKRYCITNQLSSCYLEKVSNYATGPPCPPVAVVAAWGVATAGVFRGKGDQ